MKAHRLTSLLLFVFICLSVGASQGAGQVPLPTPRPAFKAVLVAPETAILRAVLVTANAGQWQAAEKLFTAQTPPIHRKIVNWLRLTDPRGKSEFAEVATFLAANPAWPWQLTLRRRAEALMPASLSPARTIAWFTANPPLTATGKSRLIAAHEKRGDKEIVADLVRRTWHRTGFIKSQERRFYKRYRRYLRADDHWARLDYLLWRGQHHGAQRASWYVSGPRKTLANARLKLSRQSAGVDQAIKRVPAELLNDPGLVYERIRWRRQRQLTDPAFELLREAPPPGLFERKWWVERRIIIRRLLRQNRPQDAYQIAANHQQSGGPSFAEGEWLAGWIALTHLNDAGTGLQHFKAFLTKVKTPISRARGHFWAGRALAETGANALARQHYERAAKQPTTFYGQLAAQHLKQPQLALPITIDGPLGDSFQNHDLVQATQALAAADDRELTAIFFRALVRAQQAKTPPIADITAAQLARFGDQIKRPDLAVYMARQAARKGHHLITHGYPLLPATPALPALVPAVNPAVEAALLHGLIRQESAFNSRAVSRAGARGLMQLMPATAKQIAQKTKLRFATERLLEEPQFNLQLGQLYLHQMIMTFAGSYPLALAAYNAGPHRVKRWLRDYGDPRTGAISMINWIESIPFNETRNYVQRVLEATVVYRHKEASLNDLTAAHLSVHQWCLLRCQDASIAAVPTTESPKPAR